MRRVTDGHNDVYRYLKGIRTDRAKVVFCERFDAKSDIWTLTPHTHDYTELIYIMDGTLHIDVPGKKLLKSTYNLIVYPKGVFHQEHLYLSEREEIICIGVEAPELEQLDTSFEMNDDDGKFRLLIELIHSEYINRRDDSEFLIGHSISILYTLMSRCFEENAVYKRDAITTCLNYIHAHIMEDITIEQLSNVTFLSPSHLTRTIRKRTGYSPIGYIKACRVNIAKGRLKLTNDSIEEIATRCGFHDSKYFSRVFKQETGLSPRQYRNQHAHTMIKEEK